MLPTSLIRDLGALFKKEGGLAESPLALRDGQVEGRFGELHLSSVFRKIRSALDPTLTVGLHAYLRMYAENENPAAALDEFAAAQYTPAVINLDRLCRTVHLLNFMRRAQGGDASLFLPVNPNYVLMLKKNHGAYFEDILARCGIPPGWVVISVSLGLADRGKVESLAQGLGNYRAKGYRVAVHSHRKPSFESAELDLALKARPDYLILPHGLGPSRAHAEEPWSKLRSAIAVARGAEVQVIVEGIDTAAQAGLSVEAGASLVQGSYYETRRAVAC